MDRANDTYYMSRAMDLAREGLGRVAPNPSVGCVIVKDEKIVGEGRTSDGGRPHAESIALEKAGPSAKGATAYVTLEPCFHEDRLSCSSRLIEAGIAKVVVACLDENPIIKGKGVTALKAAGIETETGCLETEARNLNRGFFLTKTQNRPLVTLKIATSLDSKIATSSGESRWITGEDSRALVHKLRASHDAILTGIGTMLADDPELTTRIDGLDHKSVRVILDTNLRTPLSSRMFKTKDRGNILVFIGENNDVEKTDEHATAIPSPVSPNGKISIPFVLETLAARGITRLMVEGGQGILTSFLTSGLWDDLYIMRAPILLGADGRDAFGPLGISALSAAIRPVLASREACGQDLVEHYVRVPQ